MTPEEIERFTAMERRVEALEHRLQRLETGSTRPAPTPAAAPPAAASRRALEITFGLNWLSRIAAVTVVLALAFFFEYASENHWITEPARVALGLICGAAALFAGDRFWRKDQHTYGQALAASGIAFLFLSVWAAFGLYNLISQTAGFLLMAVVTGAAGALALRYDSSAVALLGLGGGFATPLLLGGKNPAWLVLGYALLLDAGAVLASRRRRWRWPEALALLGTIVLYAGQLPRSPQYSLFLVAYYGLFAGTEFLPVFLGLQCLAALPWAGVWGPGFAGMAGVWAITAAGLAVADRRNWPSGAIAAFVGFWLAYGYISDHAVGPWSVLALLSAAFLLFLAWPVWRAHAGPTALDFLSIAVIPLNTLFFGMACAALLHKDNVRAEGFSGIAVGLASIGAAWLLRSDRRGALAAYTSGHAAVLWGLGLETVDWVSHTASPQNFRNIASLAISVLVGAYAALLVAAGSAWRHTATRLLGILLFGVVILKLYLRDVWLLAALYRMAAFGILGVLLLGASYLYRQRTR